MAFMALVLAVLGFDLQDALAIAAGALSSVNGLVETGLANAPPGGAPTLTAVAIGIGALAGRIELLVLLAAVVRTEW
jgi:hypothetical protein